MTTERTKPKTLIKDAAIGGLLAVTLIAGSGVAISAYESCTQIDAATKLVSYYNRIQEIKRQIDAMEMWVNETKTEITSRISNTKDRLENLKETLREGLDPKQLARELAGEAIQSLTDEAFDGQSPCDALIKGVGPSVELADMALSECEDALAKYAVVLDPASGGDIAPSAMISLNSMIKTAEGVWPMADLMRDDLAWVTQKGEEALEFGAGWSLEGDGHQDATQQEVMNAIAHEMRLGNILVGRGATNIRQSSSRETTHKIMAVVERNAQAAANAYVVEAVAREASAKPRIALLREQLNSINIDNLDQMTEGQRYATRLEAQTTMQEVQAMLNASRMRQDQLLGVLHTLETNRTEEMLTRGGL
ncbi:hypothetical protein VRRI112168_03580 [Vreelandella rituensis]|uniref:Uncharacterized protein n=1 Tax=Vreelandella rituensis TaxID=2282306 RepID=A0A368U9V6_9GAMM|nr:hypothetical protein [Halomonas rituensis]RCV93734.1 hypothetical protein DU506_00850 [Halomonas rituensis]